MPKGIPKSGKNKGWFNKGESVSKKTEIKKGQRLSPETEFGKKPLWNKGLSGKDYKIFYKNGFAQPGLGKSPPNKGKYKPYKEMRRILRDIHKMKSWRISIFLRDNYICQECDRTSLQVRGLLNAHHIKHFETIIKENNIQTILDGIFCDELWNIDNGITLCKECHKTRHKVEGYRR